MPAKEASVRREEPDMAAAPSTAPSGIAASSAARPAPSRTSSATRPRAVDPADTGDIDLAEFGSQPAGPAPRRAPRLDGARADGKGSPDAFGHPDPDAEDLDDDWDTGPSGAPIGGLVAVVERLRAHVATLSLTLDMPGVGSVRRERESLLGQLDDYVLPRLRRRDAPLLAVIGGSTGAGKSTLTNSLVRREVTRSGVLRPTTRSPVLVHHPFDSGAFLSQRILPNLTRVTSEAPEPLQPIDPHAPRITGLRLVPHDGLAPGIAIIDAPDIDSLVETNRDLAVQLLAAADLWLFVTTAARYADAMPWDMLRQAAERGVAIAVVLDRVPPEAMQELRVHLATRLRDRGLGGAPLFTIAETPPQDGFLPESSVAPLQQWLRRVAGDARSRAVIADRTLKGVLGSMHARAELLARGAEAQASGWAQLHQELDLAFGAARDRLAQSLTDGSLLSGEVLARWNDRVGDGEFVHRLEAGGSGFADRLAAAMTRDAVPAHSLDAPVTHAVMAAVRAAARTATDEMLARWRQSTFGAGLLQARGHQVIATDLDEELTTSMTQWRDAVSIAVRDAVRNAAREPQRAIEPQAAGDVLFVAVLDRRVERDQVGVGPTATVAAARRIVGSFIGEETVRAITADARAELVTRAGVLLDSERRRLEKLLETTGADPARASELRSVADLVEQVSR